MRSTTRIVLRHLRMAVGTVHVCYGPPNPRKSPSKIQCSASSVAVAADSSGGGDTYLHFLSATNPTRGSWLRFASRAGIVLTPGLLLFTLDIHVFGRESQESWLSTRWYQRSRNRLTPLISNTRLLPGVN